MTMPRRPGQRLASTGSQFSTRRGVKLSWVLLGLAVSAGHVPAWAACQATGTQTTTTIERSLPREVEAVLDRLEQADGDLKDLRADVKYTVLQLIKANDDDPDDVQNFFGTIKFLKRPEPSRFFIHFEKWNDGREWANDPRQWFIFDGEWLTRASEKGRSVEREQIVRPGETAELFKLGSGPFPMPFGQSKKDILQQFDVRLVAPSGDDPPQTDHLFCTTKPASRLAERYKTVELFVGNAEQSPLAGLPIRIVVHNIRDETRETVIFEKIKKNKGLHPDRDFQLPALTKKWQSSEKRLPPDE